MLFSVSNPFASRYYALQPSVQPFNGHIKTAEQRTIIQQYGDCFRCYIWYSEEGPQRAAARPRPLLAVPTVTAHPSTASVLTSYYSMWHYNSI